jgi:Fic-DOC domain mobile mystery protein B
MSWGPSIEGETPFDTSGLKDRSITNRAQLNAAEASNIQLAAEKYLLTRPRKTSATFKYPWFLKLHKEMYGNVWEWAGIIRKHNLNIGVRWDIVSNELAQLVSDLDYWDEQWPDRLQQAVYLHHRAVHIHPFANGNGRWSRMLANIWLRRNDHPITKWPGEIGVQTSPVRAEYIQCIQQADAGDYDPLYKLHQRFT